MTSRDARHARHQLNPVLHAAVRFGIINGLVHIDEAEFAHVRDAIQVSDSVLSKHLAKLEAAGYLKVRKGAIVGRRCTWFALMTCGRLAYERHLAALRAIVEEDPARSAREP